MKKTFENSEVGRMVITDTISMEDPASKKSEH